MSNLCLLRRKTIFNLMWGGRGLKTRNLHFMKDFWMIWNQMLGTLRSFSEGLVLKSELTVHTLFPFCPQKGTEADSH